MKTSVVLFAVLCVLGAALVKGFDKQAAVVDFMAKADACKGETGTNEGDVAEIIARQPASNAAGKCLRACMFKKYEVMGANGKLAKNVAVKYAEEYTDGAADQMKIAHEVIDFCDAVAVPDDHCEAAEVYGKCFHEQMTSHGVTEFVI